MSKELKTEPMMDHEYDGIKEFDNPLPGWWLATFYGAIIFTVLYLGYYHLGGPGKDPHVTLEEDLQAIQAQQQAATASSGTPDEAALMAALNNPQKVASGKAIYEGKCASCHLADGGGSIGPNLTDNYWIHGNGSMTAIMDVVNNGVLDKGMPTWKGMLKPDEIIEVVAFVKSLKGTKPATSKEPQGQEIKE